MSAWRLFGASLALMLAGMALMFFWSAPMIQAGGLQPFDLRAGGYDLPVAQDFLTALTPEGKAAYLGAQRLADTLFPIGFLGVMALATFIALRVWSPLIGALATLPAFAEFVFDMLENAAVAGMLRAGPEALSLDQVAWASFFTTWKMRLVDAMLIVAALALAARVIWWLRPGGRYE